MSTALTPRQPSGSRGLRVLVSGLASDAHTWNLVYLQVQLEEWGHEVVNLGACVPDELLVEECLRVAPDLVVISSVNGHGFHEGARVIGALRAHDTLSRLPVVIGGKLGVHGPDERGRAEALAEAGFDGVFEDGVGMAPFRSFLARLGAGVPS
ncbi:cobalamin B12-binding domain-containing protein [Streptomyces sp. NPDC056337]|uniref:cobalamin B12-binding domain-containing protein n=1 Tax=Streptomyces sp. NPDC056337 TaxID=3345787 RepID=UPI0035D69272